ncbi:UNVERIFIED_CONTAM: hypothetical protein Sangu_1927700 [Sesamum angustifolium]|uniref:Uncharacterized protein n=1 Tax=Sesamum angustifolium TaxID=2727405 RepID=A0AAW2LVF1_9LAMI
MAKAQLNFCTYSILIFLVLSFGIIPTEERLLEIEKNTDCKKYCSIDAVIRTAGRRMLSVKSNDSISDDELLDKISRNKTIVDSKYEEIKGADSAPTTPGHSPGSGTVMDPLARGLKTSVYVYIM